MKYTLTFALTMFVTLGGAANADTHEDRAEHACTAAARAFYKVAELSHGRVKAMDTAESQGAFLIRFGEEWRSFLTSDTTPAPALKPWLLQSYAHGVSMLRTEGGAMTGWSAAERQENEQQMILDAEDELNRHCMYALGRLDGQGGLPEALGAAPAH